MDEMKHDSPPMPALPHPIVDRRFNLQFADSSPLVILSFIVALWRGHVRTRLREPCTLSNPPQPSAPISTSPLIVEARPKPPVNCYTIFREALPVQKRNKTAYLIRAGFVTKENKRYA
eukprot:9466588-Pyramimonas_sp.AAC.1